jgi:hypothetical protein
MANYYRVSPQFWRNSARTWTDDARLLAFYLLTSPHRNLEGLYWLQFAYKEPRVKRTLGMLVSADFAAYDEANEVVFVKRALRFQSPNTPNQIKGAIASLERLPHTPLLMGLLSAAECHAPSLAHAMRKAFTFKEASHE